MRKVPNVSSVVLFRSQHWRPIIDRPTTLRSSHAQPSSTAIRLVYVNLVSSMSVSSLLRQPRLVSINLVSPTPTSSRLYQPRVVQAMQVSYLSLFLFLYAFLLRQIYFREFFCSVCARGCPSLILGVRSW